MSRVSRGLLTRANAHLHTVGAAAAGPRDCDASARLEEIKEQTGGDREQTYEREGKNTNGMKKEKLKKKERRRRKGEKENAWPLGERGNTEGTINPFSLGSVASHVSSSMKLVGAAAPR